MTKTETQAFHIGDILSILTGHLVSHDHMGGIYKLLGWMTGEELSTHQLIRASVACEPVLKFTFPELAKIEYPDHLAGNKDAIFSWVDRMAREHGEWHEVPKLSEEDYEKMGAIEELVEIISKSALLSSQVS